MKKLNWICECGNIAPYGCQCGICGNIQLKIKREKLSKLCFQGKRKTITEWSKITNIHRDCIRTRIHKLGWTVKKALTTPPKHYVKEFYKKYD